MSFSYVPLKEDEVQPQRRGANQRAFVRYHCGPATPGRVQVNGVEWQRGWVLDLSVTGIGLLLSRPLERGLEIMVQLKSAVQKKTFQLAAVIRHSTEQVDGDWVVGCEFLEKLPDEMLDALLA